MLETNGPSATIPFYKQPSFDDQMMMRPMLSDWLHVTDPTSLTPDIPKEEPVEQEKADRKDSGVSKTVPSEEPIVPSSSLNTGATIPTNLPS